MQGDFTLDVCRTDFPDLLPTANTHYLLHHKPTIKSLCMRGVSRPLLLFPRGVSVSCSSQYIHCIRFNFRVVTRCSI